MRQAVLFLFFCWFFVLGDRVDGSERADGNGNVNGVNDNDNGGGGGGGSGSDSGGGTSTSSGSSETENGGGGSGSGSGSGSEEDEDDSGARTKTLVQCHMDSSLDETLIFNKTSGLYRRPTTGVSGTEAFAPMEDEQQQQEQENESFVQVRECWCARVLNRPREYCASTFDTCQVQGSHGPVLCFANEAKINVVRGIWPFCLFWIFALVYMWIASEPGRRARGFLKRHAVNFINERQRQRQNRRARNTNQMPPSTIALGADTDTDANIDLDQESTTNYPLESRQQRLEAGDSANNNSQRTQIQTDTMQNGLTYSSAAAHSGEAPNLTQILVEDNIIRTSSVSNETLSNLHTQPYHQHQHNNNNHNQAQNEVDVDANADAERENSDDDIDVLPLDDDATHVTVRTITPEVAIYPPEFRSRSNYLQLLQELCHMYRYEPDRMAQLWHTAWIHERQRGLRQLQWQRRNTARNSNNNSNDDREDQNNDSNTTTGAYVFFPPSFWGGVTTAIQTQGAAEQPPTPRTIQLALKTKRFQTQETEKQKRHDGSQPDDKSENTDIDPEDSKDVDKHNLEVCRLEQTSSSNIQKKSSIDTRKRDDDSDYHLDDGHEDEEGRSCVICFVDFQDGDIIGDIPCKHMFHKECLKSWLQRSNRCPLCQNEGIAASITEQDAQDNSTDQE